MEVLNADKVRVKEEILSFFKKGVTKIDPDAELYLFGSRTDMEKRGGDIDFLILSGKKLSSETLRELKYSFWRQFGEQKVDLVNFTFEEDATFKKLIMLDAIKL
ncbi:nucleotidyltransferase domain-containing protein [Ekhidna sp.]|uniref:nucleotidyltransferase domain-containing protein n=1 Tax=Ekhidna sp. TaxID=2608089 RepID=UPI0032EE1AEC